MATTTRAALALSASRGKKKTAGLRHRWHFWSIFSTPFPVHALISCHLVWIAWTCMYSRHSHLFGPFLEACFFFPRNGKKGGVGELARKTTHGVEEERQTAKKCDTHQRGFASKILVV